MNNDYARAPFDPIHPDPPTPEPPVEDIRYTPNYKFLLVSADTVTSWLTILNQNFTAIDGTIHDIALRTSIDGEVPPEAIEDIIKLNAQVAEIGSTVEHMQEDITTLMDTYESIAQDISHSKQDIALLTANYTLLDARYKAISTDIQTLETNLNKLTETVNLHIEDYNALEARVTALEEKE